MAAPFTMRQRLRFSHCDPAGIAYYPQLFALCDHVIEEWTEQVFAMPRAEFHGTRNLALPTADLQAQFSAVCKLGDRLDFLLTVDRVGRSSVGFHIHVDCEGEHRFTVRYVQVLTDHRDKKPLPWPAEWRTALTPKEHDQ
ncbi:MAG: acyl-CoA thioesterase [Parasphingopyxis sp.]